MLASTGLRTLLQEATEDGVRPASCETVSPSPPLSPEPRCNQGGLGCPLGLLQGPQAPLQVHPGLLPLRQQVQALGLVGTDQLGGGVGEAELLKGDPLGLLVDGQGFN